MQTPMTDDLLKRARENWISALFAAGYKFMDFEDYCLRMDLGLDREDWNYFQDAGLEQGRVQNDIVAGMGRDLTARLSDGTEIEMQTENLRNIFAELSEFQANHFLNCLGFNSDY